jgi:hypothetical protein
MVYAGTKGISHNHKVAPLHLYNSIALYVFLVMQALNANPLKSCKIEPVMGSIASSNNLGVKELFSIF